MRFSVLFTLALILVLPFAASAQENGEEHPALARIKSLEGTWFSKGEDAASPEDDATLVYKVISGGSAVTETIFAGTPHEMLSVYYVQGGEIMLTHYCILGNRPCMRAAEGTAENVLSFECTGHEGGLQLSDSHMHKIEITFVDADHLKLDCTLYEGGQPKGIHSFELERAKN